MAKGCRHRWRRRVPRRGPYTDTGGSGHGRSRRQTALRTVAAGDMRAECRRAARPSRSGRSAWIAPTPALVGSAWSGLSQLPVHGHRGRRSTESGTRLGGRPSADLHARLHLMHRLHARYTRRAGRGCGVNDDPSRPLGCAGQHGSPNSSCCTLVATGRGPRCEHGSRYARTPTPPRESLYEILMIPVVPDEHACTTIPVDHRKDHRVWRRE